MASNKHGFARRIAVLDYLREKDDWVGVPEIHGFLFDNGHEAQLLTVRRYMQQLADEGVVVKRIVPGITKTHRGNCSIVEYRLPTTEARV